MCFNLPISNLSAKALREELSVMPVMATSLLLKNL